MNILFHFEPGRRHFKLSTVLSPPPPGAHEEVLAGQGVVAKGRTDLRAAARGSRTHRSAWGPPPPPPPFFLFTVSILFWGLGFFLCDFFLLLLSCRICSWFVYCRCFVFVSKFTSLLFFSRSVFCSCRDVRLEFLICFSIRSNLLVR